MSYQETVNEIIKIPDPVLAAKKLQDLAQGYRSQENIGVLVVRLMLSQSEKSHMRDMLKYQFENEQQLLAELKIRDIEREETRKKMELEEMNENVPMDVLKMKGGRRRKQVGQMFNGRSSHVAGSDDEDVNGVAIKPFPGGHGNTDDPTMDWEIMLQKRLTEEVKDKELIHAMRSQTDHDPFFPVVESDENWSTTTKLKGQVRERVVTLPPQDDFERIRNGPAPPPRQMIPEADQLSTGSLEFRRELKHPLDVDRDAVLFHNMQLQRHKGHNISSRSIDSIQSDPAYASTKDVPFKEKKASSHSIEVLLHGPTAQHKRQVSFGGSQSFANDEQQVVDKGQKGDSCPTDMSDRLKMLEQKGFLPKESDTKKDQSVKSDRKIQLEEAEKVAQHEVVELNIGADINGVETDDESDDSGDDFEFFPDYETVESVARYRENLKESNSHNSNHSDSQPKHINLDGDLDRGKANFSSGGLLNVETDSSSEDISVLYATVSKLKEHKVSNTTKIGNGTVDSRSDFSRKSPSERRSPVLLESSEKTKIVHGSPKSVVSEQSKHTSVKTRRPPPPPVDKVTIDHGSKGYQTKSGAVINVPVTFNSEYIDNHRVENKAHLKEIKPLSSTAGEQHKPSDEQPKEPPPIPPRIPLKSPLAPKEDINSNSIRSLEDLIAYNRQYQQQQLSYKVHPKAAPVPPPKVPETTMVTKTASQRSIVITYL